MYDPNRPITEQIEEVNQTVRSRLTKEEMYAYAGLPMPEPKPRYEVIEDNTGRWMRDNETGIEYSCAIGLHLISR